MKHGDVKVGTGTDPDGIRVRIDNWDPVEGNLDWAEITLERACELANELLAAVERWRARNAAAASERE